MTATDRFEQAFADAFEHVVGQQDASATTVDDDRALAPVLDLPRRRPQLAARTRWFAVAAVIVAAGVVGAVFGLSQPGAGIVAAPVAAPAALPSTATLDFGSEPSLDYAAVAVTLSSSDQGLQLEVSGDQGRGMTPLGSYSARQGSYWSMHVRPGLTVAMMNGLAANPMSLDTVDVVRSQYLHFWDVTVVVLQRTASSAGSGVGPATMIWQDYSGRVWDSRNQMLPSARLGVPGRQLVVFRDQPLGVWGYFDALGTDHRTLPLSTEPVGTLYAIDAKVEDGYYLGATLLGMVPAGGRDPEPRLTTAEQDWTSGALGRGGPEVFLAYASRIKVDQKLVTSVTYRDASGRRVTYRP